MDAELSILNLVLEASLLVQLVMLTLLLGSVASWAIIFQKRGQYAAARRQADRFEKQFWTGGNLGEMYNRLSNQSDGVSGLERVFVEGFREFSRLRQQAAAPDAQLDAARRAMRIALGREADTLDNRVPFLATVGSVSPYIGLFGTVWGIMNAFRALGVEQQATLSTVAPGIAEALIATALGLFAAIPAVMAYNRYTGLAERLLHRYELFMEEFTNILHRHAHTPASPGDPAR